MKAECKAFKGQPTDKNHPCYESILFTEWRFGAGWDHKNKKRRREIKKAQIGKIALLTALEPDKKEDNRKIIGFFKIDRIDNGEEEETIVYGNPLESLEIDPTLVINFWDYYRNPEAPEKKVWRTGLFRYVEDSTIAIFLKDLKGLYSRHNLATSDIQKIDNALTSLEDVGPQAPLVNAKKAEKDPAVSVKSDDTKTCNYCGRKNSYDARFCNRCGKQLDLVCGKCKASNPPGSKCCSQCGLKLRASKQYNAEAIKDKLLEYGEELKNEPHEYHFTPDEQADTLILEDSNAFLFAVIFDQGIDAEKAWAAPYEIKKRMGHLDVGTIADMPEKQIADFLGQKPKLHRFWPTMARRLREASSKIQEEYNGEACNIWKDTFDSILTYKRLLAFDGISQKKASMAVNILYRDLGVEFRNIEGIDVSYDIMIRRVFSRTGIVLTDTMQNIINAARKLNPDYPGALDYPAWYIGRTWCSPTNPECNKCCLNNVCAKSGL